MRFETDYYAILEVDPAADDRQVRHAFRERVRACHPDRVANLDADLRKLAEEKMVQLNEAYAVLRNPARRAAYDQHRHQEITAEPVVATAPEESRDPYAEAQRARSRMGEGAFVARAACEEFEMHLRQANRGNIEWTPMAMPGVTMALKGSRGRRDYYVILLAGAKLDERTLRRFLRRLQAWTGNLKGKFFGKSRALGFAGALEFVGRDRLLRVIEQFNTQTEADSQLAPVTLVDLVTWQVYPGETELGSRIASLTR